MTKKFTLKWMDWLMILIFAGALAVLITSCGVITPDQQAQVKEQIKDQVNKPENQAKVIEQINEVLK